MGLGVHPKGEKKFFTNSGKVIFIIVLRPSTDPYCLYLGSGWGSYFGLWFTTDDKWQRGNSP